MQISSRVKFNNIVFPEKYFRKAIVIKSDIEMKILTRNGFNDHADKASFETSSYPKLSDLSIGNRNIANY